jgi:hypothetical protein
VPITTAATADTGRTMRSDELRASIPATPATRRNAAALAAAWTVSCQVTGPFHGKPSATGSGHPGVHGTAAETTNDADATASRTLAVPPKHHPSRATAAAAPIIPARYESRGSMPSSDR